MKKIVAIVIVVLMLASILIATISCKNVNTLTTKEEGATVSEGDSSGKQVTLHMLMEDILETRTIEAVLPEFEKATGIKVEFEKVQYLDMHQKLVTQFMSPTSQYDVIEIDNYWAGEFPTAGWIISLDDYIKRDNFDLSGYAPIMLDMVGTNPAKTSDKTVYMIPMWGYPMGLVYRTDLMADPKLQSAYKNLYNKDLKIPESLDEFVQQCKFMKENAGVFGSAMEGGRGDPIVMEWSNYLYSVGGEYYDKEWNATVNNDKGVQAAEAYKQNVSTAPDGTLSFNIDDAMRVMAEGKAFSMVSYVFVLPLFADPSASKIVGKVEMVPMPGNGGMLGAFGWGIASNSQYKDQAWEFIKWVESFDIVKKRALAGGAPTRIDVFDDPDVLKKWPFMATQKQLLLSGKPIPEFQYSTEMVEILGRELSLICSGEKTTQEGLDQAAKELNDLVKKANIK